MQASWPEEGRPGSFPTRSLVGLGVGPDCLLSRTWGGLAAAPCERVSPPQHHWRRPRSPSCFRLVGATCVLHLPGAHGQDLVSVGVSRSWCSQLGQGRRAGGGSCAPSVSGGLSRQWRQGEVASEWWVSPSDFH